jgi:leader peptidase (prepilin peptidase) / N-methyltransferase
MEALRAFEPWSTHVAAYAFAVLLGALWGSFANVCIYRMPPTDEFPRGRSVVTPGSHCGRCGAPVRWYDNVPMLSYLWLRGRCRDCGAAFSARYLLVEAVTAALFGVAWWATVDASSLFEPFELRLLRFGVYAAFVLVMVIITFIDLDHQLILDRVTYPSIALFYGAGLLLGRHWSEGLAGAALGYGLVWSIAEAYYWLRGRHTGAEGMGLGDGKLLAVIGALLGWQGVVVALFGGATVGSVLGVAALLVGRRAAADDDNDAAAPVSADGAGGAGADAGTHAAGDGAAARSLAQTEIPFGPYLALAAMFYLFAEPWIRINVVWLGS